MFSSRLQVILIGGHPISSCSFLMPVGGGEPRVFFLFHHLKLSPLPISGCSSWNIVKVKNKQTNKKTMKGLSTYKDVRIIKLIVFKCPEVSLKKKQCSVHLGVFP